MKEYQALLADILNYGKHREDRTGVGTISLFGHQTRYNLRHGFPLVTTKMVHFASVVHELLWFLSGSTNTNQLQCSIWDEWATAEKTAKFGRPAGELGPIYGKQWRAWGRNWTDQIKNVIEQIKTNPTSRRLIVTAWNPDDVDRVELPPCHTLFQFYVHGKELSCQLYQRSADAFLGVPFNIASYALLMQMIAQCTGLIVGDFVHSIGDAHIYKNHMPQVHTLLDRTPRALPWVTLTPEIRDIDEFTFEDIDLLGYDPYPVIKAPVAV